MATESEYVRGKIAAHANELLSLGTDGLRIDAAKRKEKPVSSSVTRGVTDEDPFLDMPVADLQAIFSKLPNKPSYVTQEVRTWFGARYVTSFLTTIHHRFTSTGPETSPPENTPESVKPKPSNTLSPSSPRSKRTESPLFELPNP